MKKYDLEEILWTGMGFGVYELIAKAIMTTVKTYLPEKATMKDLNRQQTQFRIITRSTKFAGCIVLYLLNGYMSFIWLANFHFYMNDKGNWRNLCCTMYIYITILSMVQLCNFDQYTTHTK